MARPRGSTNKTAQDAQETVNVKESPEKADAGNTDKAPKIASHTMWLYHKTKEAKVFNTGDTILEGYTDTPDTGGK